MRCFVWLRRKSFKSWFKNNNVRIIKCIVNKTLRQIVFEIFFHLMTRKRKIVFLDIAREYAIFRNCQTKKVCFWWLIDSSKIIQMIWSHHCYVRCNNVVLKYDWILIKWTENNQSQWKKTTFNFDDFKKKSCKSVIMRIKDETKLKWLSRDFEKSYVWKSKKQFFFKIYFTSAKQYLFTRISNHSSRSCILSFSIITFKISSLKI